MSSVLIRSTLPRIVHLGSTYRKDPSSPSGVIPGLELRVLPGTARYDAAALEAVLQNAGSKAFFDRGDFVIVTDEVEADKLLSDMDEGQALATIADVMDSGAEARQLLHDFLDGETRPKVVKAIRAKLEDFGDDDVRDEHTREYPAEKVVLSARLAKEGKPTATASAAQAKRDKGGKSKARA
jgi:hypothetical protein